MRAGSLSGWTETPIDIESEIRSILERANQSDRSTPACKAWARELVTALAPAWHPGTPLSFAAAQRVGEAFARLTESARPSIAEATRRKRPKPYKRGAERKPRTRKAS